MRLCGHQRDCWDTENYYNQSNELMLIVDGDDIDSDDDGDSDDDDDAN